MYNQTYQFSGLSYPSSSPAVRTRWYTRFDAGRWSGEFLDEMRQCGDPAADAAIELCRRRHGHRRELLEAVAASLTGPGAVQQTSALVEPLFDHYPELAMLLDPGERARECRVHDDEMAAAAAFFEAHAADLLFGLLFYALPMSYAAHHSARALQAKGSAAGVAGERGGAAKDAITLILAMFSPNGLAIHAHARADVQGSGVIEALRVRLLRACARALVLTDRGTGWNATRTGVPANQEDTAWTFLACSCLVIDGLGKLRIDADRAGAETFFGVWRKVGRLLGLDETLLPATLQEAERLMLLIKDRQVDAPILAGRRNEAGQQMTAELLDVLRASLPWPLRASRRVPASVMRAFLSKSPVDLAGSLGIPRTYGLDELMRLWFSLAPALRRFRFLDMPRRYVSRHVALAACGRLVGRSRPA